jgi:hypothetical protein
MTHCPENISPDIGVALIKVMEHLLDLFSFGCSGCRARVVKNRKPVFSGEPSYDRFIHEGQWTDHGKFFLKKHLGWHHGADLAGVTDI